MEFYEKLIYVIAVILGLIIICNSKNTIGINLELKSIKLEVKTEKTQQTQQTEKKDK